MLTLRGSTITMNRCDSVCVDVNLRLNDGTEYELQEGDQLFFAVKKNAKDKNYAIAPRALVGKVLELFPSDTEHLEPGEYLYDVRLVTKRGYESTVIRPSILNIEPSITGAGDR